MGRLFVVGSLNIDTVVSVARHPALGETVVGETRQMYWGGKGANQAVAAARIEGSSSGIHFIGRVGDDAAGSEYRERLATRGIDVSNLFTTVGSATGSAFIVVSGQGENTIVVSPGANARLEIDDLRALERLDRDDVVVVTLEVPIPVVIAAARHAELAGARFVLNFSPVLPVPPQIIRQADPVIVNEHEQRELVRRFGRPASVLVTRGARGSEWGAVSVPAQPGVRVVDTTGAGDAYCGALALALADGEPRLAAMMSATVEAALAVGRFGAQ